jgi:hypothetical protein
MNIPSALKRDANNVAPFMLDPPEYVDDATDMVPIKVDVKFSNGWAPPHPALVSPEASLPETPPSWVPPWASKS